jgi:hypothetical protein
VIILSVNLTERLIAAEPPRAFIEALHAAVVAHAAGKAQPDDLTCVVVKRNAALRTSH